MSLRILMDEDSQDKRLVSFFCSSGRDVVTVNEVELSGKPDSVVLDYARQSDRVMFTFNFVAFGYLDFSSNFFGDRTQNP